MSGPDILFEDGEALVIDKPAGLPVDRPRAGGASLADRLDLLRLGFVRAPVAVHRLDTDTSGCLLLARNPKALRRFSRAFEERQVEKIYLGIVAGHLEEDSGDIMLSLAKISSERAGWRMIVAKSGKPARTVWRRLAVKDGLTLVEFRPETGRTHQIRVHAEHGLGSALLGDPVYGASLGSTDQRAARTMLHASALRVKRDGKPDIAALAPFPADFARLGFAAPPPAW
ncbi:RNA pseudouridine synthase [Croceicoccus sp. F390]|uniref:RNA pseudouridine synthase n=1 Tax=Croceicoccus esteveae TaxID=3075597 RepID=A0ABU2ZK14_9SPHN|nr:RNA pseudouridine synthase [Croceicoccus sp. F390]MDT0576720.1 RNA pseudouridine synthase [Croceicoccus sp. F390]